MNEKDRKEKRADNELVGKNVSWYQTFLSAWVENRMEKDKQIINLSSLAIGVLILLRKEIGNSFQFGIWLLAGICFIISIMVLLQIFSQNSNYIENLIKNTDHEKINSIEKSLRSKTFWGFNLFIVGIILTFLLAWSSTGFYIAILKGV